MNKQCNLHYTAGIEIIQVTKQATFGKFLINIYSCFLVFTIYRKLI